MSYRIFMIKIPISNLDHHKKKKSNNWHQKQQTMGFWILAAAAKITWIQVTWSPDPMLRTSPKASHQQPPTTGWISLTLPLYPPHSQSYLQDVFLESRWFDVCAPSFPPLKCRMAVVRGAISPWQTREDWRLISSYNRYLAVAGRAVRRSLQEGPRAAAERRGQMDLKFAKWEVRILQTWIVDVELNWRFGNRTASRVSPSPLPRRTRKPWLPRPSRNKHIPHRVANKVDATI